MISMENVEGRKILQLPSRFLLLLSPMPACLADHHQRSGIDRSPDQDWSCSVARTEHERLAAEIGGISNRVVPSVRWWLKTFPHLPGWRARSASHPKNLKIPDSSTASQPAVTTTSPASFHFAVQSSLIFWSSLLKRPRFLSSSLPCLSARERKIINMAFVPRPTLPRVPQSAPRFTCSQQPVSRRQAFTLFAAGAAGAATLFAPTASKASGLEETISKVLFPKQGFNAPDALKSSDKIVNKGILSSKEGKKALAQLAGVDDSMKALYESFKSNPQVEISTTVRKAVSISDLRTSLNIINDAIDEASQAETDKMARSIIQDIGELQMAASLKPGTTRTQKKIERTNDWFLQITADFTKLLSFYS